MFSHNEDKDNPHNYGNNLADDLAKTGARIQSLTKREEELINEGEYIEPIH